MKKTRIIIEIETSKLKENIMEGEDYCEDQEKEWHDAIFKLIEGYIHSDEFEHHVLGEWADWAEYLNPKAREFSDIGNLMIRITQEVD